MIDNYARRGILEPREGKHVSHRFGRSRQRLWLRHRSEARDPATEEEGQSALPPQIRILCDNPQTFSKPQFVSQQNSHNK